MSGRILLPANGDLPRQDVQLRAPAAAESDYESEYDDAEEFQEIDVQENVYGGSIFSVIHDGYDIFTGTNHDELESKVNWNRMIFCLFSLVVNYTLQIMLLYYSYYFVASPAIARAQTIYKEYHHDVFESDGTYNSTKWDAWSPDKQHQLCNLVYSNKFFLYCILCLWWMTILNEFRETERMIRNFGSIPGVDGTTDPMIEKGEEGLEKIVGLVPKIRCTLYVFVIVPKLIISIVLLVLGSMWLTATEDFADLVLNAVALEFIIQVDEIIFDSLFPAAVRTRISNVKLVVARMMQTPEVASKELAAALRRSWFYYVLIFFTVFLYLQFGQRLPFVAVLPGYANDAACPAFWEERAQRPCGMFDPWSGKDCFPYGPNAEL